MAFGRPPVAGVVEYLHYTLLNVPSFIVVLCVFMGVVYIGINMLYTHDCDSMDTIRDDNSVFAQTSFEQSGSGSDSRNSRRGYGNGNGNGSGSGNGNSSGCGHHPEASLSDIGDILPGSIRVHSRRRNVM